MPDLLVKLYALPPLAPAEEKLNAAGIRLHRPLALERHLVMGWVTTHFSDRWASEVEMTFSGHPISCFVALDEASRIVGFACYDATFKGFFGPTGVAKEWRGKGAGAALLLRCLHALKEEGYAYAIIGGSGVDEYYQTTVGAIPIAESAPGPYGGRISLAP